MKTENTLKKIALLASGIAVFTLNSAYAADTESNVSDETTVVTTDTPADPATLCPNGNPRGTRAENCTVGQSGRRGNFANGRANSGRKGNFANGRGNSGCNGKFTNGRGSNGRGGNFANGRGHGGRGNVARSGGRQGNMQGRRGMGPGKGQGDGKGPHDGSCVQAPAETVES